MPFLGMADKARNDPMGPSTMGLLKNNADWLRNILKVEHIVSTGEHNAREVPRVVRRISGTTVSPSSSDIASVTNPSTGKYVLTLASGRFNSSWMACQINPCGSDVANKPYLVGFRVASSTSLEVYLQQLTSALGYEPAGNNWSATNMDFDIAIHSLPLSAGSYSVNLPSNSIIGDPLKPSRWNALVRCSAKTHELLAAEHDPATGAHTTRQVASYSGMWRYNGASVSLESGSAPGISITRSSPGVYAVTSSKTLTAQAHVFVSPDYSRQNSGNNASLYRTHVLQTSTTTFTVYVYSFNRTLSIWSRADGDFWLAIHTG